MRVTVTSWNDLGAALGTLKELDVSSIREEAERPLTIACLGDQQLQDIVVRLLSHSPGQRYGPVGSSPLRRGSLNEVVPGGDADMLLLLIDGREPVSSATADGLRRLSNMGLPTTIAVLRAAIPAEAGSQLRPHFAAAHVVAIPDPDAPSAADTLADGVLAQLPEQLKLAAGRRLPGLRPAVARFDWSRMIRRYDRELANVAAR